MRKEQLLERLEEQSNNPRNDPVIGRIKELSRDISNYYGIDEFDYKGELQALSNWLSNVDNYNKTFNLIKKSVKLSGNDEDDSQIILGSFALALGNPVKVIEKNGSAKVVQFIPNDFASKSGMSDYCVPSYGLSGFCGLGDWVVLELSGNFNNSNKKGSVYKPITLARDISTNVETLAYGVSGIKTTANRMKQMTNEYLEHNHPDYVNGRKAVEKWAEEVLRERNVWDNKSKYLGTLANKLSDSKVVRYQKDPLKIEKGKLESHEWIQTVDRTLKSGCGDCDDLSLAMGGFVGLMGEKGKDNAIGLTYRLGKCDPKKQNSFTHVYNVFHYPDGEVDGYTGTQDVVCDIVYQKRLGGKGYGREPKGFGVADIRVL